MRAEDRITCSIDPSVMERVDAAAREAGMSRSAAVTRLLEKGLGAAGCPVPCGVFIKMSPDVLGLVEAWAERTGEDDIPAMLYAGFIDGVADRGFLNTATEPVRIAEVRALMEGPDAPVDGLAALWMNPTTDGTMHPGFVYKSEPGAIYGVEKLMDALGVSGTAYSANVVDPIAMGYEEVYRRPPRD